MAFGITHVIKQLPTATGNLVGTRCDVWLRHRESRTWQDDVRRQDVFHGWNTTLEVQVDVQDVALTHGRDVRAGHITLYIVVLVDDGDNLLLRQVEDVRAAGYIQRTGLRRCQTVEREVLLPVGEVVIIFFSNNNSSGHRITLIIVSTGSTFYFISAGTGYGITICASVNLIALAAIVIVTLTGEGQRIHLCLIRSVQSIVGVFGDDLSGSVWGIAKDNRFLHNVVLTWSVYRNRSPVVLFVRQAFKLSATKDCVSLDGLCYIIVI